MGKKHKKSYSPEKWQEAKKLYQQGNSLRLVAETTGIPKSTIEGRIKAEGWERKTGNVIPITRPRTRKIKEETQKLLGVDLDKAEKTQIHKGRYIVQVDGKEYSCKVRDLHNAVEKGCVYCDDFKAKLADISVGSVGSPDGYSTVIVRSDAGKKLLEKLNLTKGDVNTEEVTKLAIFKKQRAAKSFAPILQDVQVQPTPQS